MYWYPATLGKSILLMFGLGEYACLRSLICVTVRRECSYRCLTELLKGSLRKCRMRVNEDYYAATMYLFFLHDCIFRTQINRDWYHVLRTCPSNLLLVLKKVIVIYKIGEGVLSLGHGRCPSPSFWRLLHRVTVFCLHAFWKVCNISSVSCYHPELFFSILVIATALLARAQTAASDVIAALNKCSDFVGNLERLIIFSNTILGSSLFVTNWTCHTAL